MNGKKKATGLTGNGHDREKKHTHRQTILFMSRRKYLIDYEPYQTDIVIENTLDMNPRRVGKKRTNQIQRRTKRIGSRIEQLGCVITNSQRHVKLMDLY